MTLTLTDHAGRTVTLAAPARRVYPTGNPASAALWCVAPDRLAGWHAPEASPADQVVPSKLAALPTVPRLSGPGVPVPPVEAVAAVGGVDLIVDVGICAGHFVDHADRLQLETGVPVLMVDGRLSQVGAALDLLGRALDAKVRCAGLAAWARDTKARVANAITDRPGPRVHYAVDAAKTVRRGSIHSEPIESLGGRLSPEISDGPAGRVRVAPEAVAAWDPEVIVTLDPALAEPDQLPTAWRDTSAARQGRVHAAPGLFLSWLDHPPSFNRLIGLPWLASVLYPGLFDGDLADHARAFYTLFYGIDVDPARIRDSLARAG